MRCEAAPVEWGLNSLLIRPTRPSCTIIDSAHVGT